MPTVHVETALMIIGSLVGIVGTLVLYGRKHERWSAIKSKAADDTSRSSD